MNDFTAEILKTLANKGERIFCILQNLRSLLINKNGDEEQEDLL